MERFDKIKDEDIFGVRRYRLIFALSQEDAKEHWHKFDQKQPIPADYAREEPLEEIAGYIGFAYGKAGDRRGLSASRSLDHFIELLWLLGDEYTEQYKEFKHTRESEYAPYGWPMLYRINKWFDLHMTPICTAQGCDNDVPESGSPFGPGSTCTGAKCPAIICTECTNKGVTKCETCN